MTWGGAHVRPLQQVAFAIFIISSLTIAIYAKVIQ